MREYPRCTACHRVQSPTPRPGLQLVVDLKGASGCSSGIGAWYWCYQSWLTNAGSSFLTKYGEYLKGRAIKGVGFPSIGGWTGKLHIASCKSHSVGRWNLTIIPERVGAGILGPARGGPAVDWPYQDGVICFIARVFFALHVSNEQLQFVFIRNIKNKSQIYLAACWFILWEQVTFCIMLLQKL